MGNRRVLILVGFFVAIFLLVSFAGCAGFSVYNGLVRSEEAVNEAWGNVETAYQRRADLVPNLVNTVRGAADFEQETLEAVTSARARATSIQISGAELGNQAQVEEFQAAQTQLSGALGRLLFVSENYPQLRATEAFRDLQAQLEGTENRINVARSRYNAAVRSYNTDIRTFPGVLLSGPLGHTRRHPFEAEKGAEQAPEVDFSE